MKNLEGKKALILGIASNRPIAWGISESLKNRMVSDFLEQGG